jgi:hypothetical protein
MALLERVASYEVSVLRNTFVPYREVIKLTTDTGQRAFLALRSWLLRPAQGLRALAGQEPAVASPVRGVDGDVEAR